MLFLTLTVGAALSSSLLASALPANVTGIDSTPLAQVITKCTVPNTAALTFDDGPYQYIQVRAFAIVLVSNFLITAAFRYIGHLKGVDRCRCEGDILLEWQQLCAAVLPSLASLIPFDFFRRVHLLQRKYTARQVCLWQGTHGRIAHMGAQGSCHPLLLTNQLRDEPCRYSFGTHHWRQARFREASLRQL